MDFNFVKEIPESILIANKRLWNFIVFQVKFNRFLHPNEHTQKIFYDLVRRFGAVPSKIGHFQSSESIFEAKYQLNLPENDFFLNIKLGEQL